MVKMMEYLEMKPEDKADHMVCCVCQEKYASFIVDKGIDGLHFYCYDHSDAVESRALHENQRNNKDS